VASHCPVSMQGRFLLTLATVAGLLLAGCQADIYLHYPRGSNNRLNETSAARTNANRLFDSQNNNRGGYNVGEFGAQQFDEKYFYGSGGASRLSVEWTMQHGCRDGRQGCRVVVQAMCQPLAGAGLDTLRNGNSTQTQGFQAAAKPLDETVDSFLARKAASATAQRGLHEPFEWYDACNARERNRGLFTADQRLRGGSAVYTRQNPAGTRRGYECPEERDYYPYWHPTPWLDVAVLTDNLAECPALVAASAAPTHACVRTFAADSGRRLWAVPENNEFDCAKNGGRFVAFYPYLEVASAIDNEAACSARGYRWAVPHRHRLSSLQPACLVPPPPLDCRLAPTTRDNHLGDKLGGGPVAYDWQLPNFPSGDAQRCVLRLRYNLTSSDSEQLIRQNPLVQPGLQLAVNSNQVGRVFQDRSHVFQLHRVPVPVASNLHHVGVRGKRGNIVQVYPAVEYDFTPTRLSARVGDHLFLQWSGSNSHNNGAPAGDGQAGDDGAGAGGTDRSNLAEAGHANDNLPLPWEASGFLNDGAGRAVWAWHGQLDGLAPRDFGLALASAGYYRCFAKAACGADSEEAKTPLDPELNAAPASFPGLLIRLDRAGQFKFICTRNNNFSNRSHKWLLTVTD
ncbi:hypothetical protein BOX15_Mlig012640g1, partial [Macrostomum lignano]